MGVSRQTEAGFQRAILALAKLHGWEWFHVYDSRRCRAGFPDLVLVRPPVALFVELKTPAGRVRPAQAKWLALLSACGLDARVWRPGDWPEIERVLAGEGE